MALDKQRIIRADGLAKYHQTMVMASLNYTRASIMHSVLFPIRLEFRTACLEYVASDLYLHITETYKETNIEFPG